VHIKMERRGRRVRGGRLSASIRGRLQQKRTQELATSSLCGGLTALSSEPKEGEKGFLGVYHGTVNSD